MKWLGKRTSMDRARDQRTAPGQQCPPTARRRAFAYLGLALLLAAGCTTKTTLWGDPDRSPAIKADMRYYVQDSYICVLESEQEIHYWQLAPLRQRDAQRLYEACMSARGYDVRHR